MTDSSGVESPSPDRASEHERYGLPDAYPYSEPDFRADQAEHADWYRYEGPTPNTLSVALIPGELYEIWPGGSLFNSAGSCIGHLHRTAPPTVTKSRPQREIATADGGEADDPH